MVEAFAADILALKSTMLNRVRPEKSGFRAQKQRVDTFAQPLISLFIHDCMEMGKSSAGIAFLFDGDTK